MKTSENPRKSTPPKSDVLLNSPTAGKRALIYSRVSTVDQDAQNQVAQLKDYAAAQGWQVVDAITDTCSGATAAPERAGLGKVLALAHQRRFDLLLFWDLSRLSREGSRKTIGYLTELEGYGIGWHSFAEPYISTLGIFSDAIIALLSALAKQERIRIGERTRAGLLRAKANGKTLGRPRTASGRIDQARKLRAGELSFAEIGRRLGVSRVRAYQLCRDPKTSVTANG